MTLERRRFLGLMGVGVAALPYLRPVAGGAAALAATPGPARLPALLAARSRVVIAAIGGAGGHILTRSVHGRVAGAEYVAVHRFRQALDRTRAEVKLRVGPRAARGLDGGGRPEHGRRSMEGARERLGGILRDADLVILLAGMGGGTATGGAPVVARVAREAGALTMAVVTRPFGFEGSRRNMYAADGIRELSLACDVTVVVPNDEVLAIVDPDVPYLHVIERAGDAVAACVRAVAAMALASGARLVCAGLADVRAVLARAGVGGVGIGTADGPDRAGLAAANALASPLLRHVDLRGAASAFLQIAAAGVSLREVQRVAGAVYNALPGDAVVVLGDTVEPALGDSLSVTLVALGYARGTVRPEHGKHGHPRSQGARPRGDLERGGRR